MAYRIHGVDIAVQVQENAGDIGVAVGSRSVEERLLAEEDQGGGLWVCAERVMQLAYPLLRALRSAPRLVRNCGTSYVTRHTSHVTRQVPPEPRPFARSCRPCEGESPDKELPGNRHSSTRHHQAADCHHWHSPATRCAR
jgi:hypothetical protein